MPITTLLVEQGILTRYGFRFFETEAVAVLTMLVSRYKIEVKDEPQFASETFEERKERVLVVKRGLSLTYVLFITSLHDV